MRGGWRFLFVLGLAGLAGCGFHPVYGTHNRDGSPVTDEMAQVEILPIDNRTGQMLRNDLLDRFNLHGRPAHPLYHLSVALHVTEDDVGSLANGTTTLSAIHVSGDYILSDQTGKTLINGTALSTSQYDKLRDLYGTLAAHDSALERSINEVSEQLTARISSYFAEHPNGNTP